MSSTRSHVLAPADAELLAAARFRAARVQPYLASAVFAMVPVPAPELGTFAVDRWWRLYVDMDAAREWGVAETSTVLLHEAHHLVRDHHGRADTVPVRHDQSYLWNLAADAAINDDLAADSLPMPSLVLPKHLGMRGGQLEEVYFQHLVAQEEAFARTVVTCGSGAGGVTLDIELGDLLSDEAPGLTDVDAIAIRRAVAHGVVVADAQGLQVSPGLARWARVLLNPQVPWQSLLRSALGRSLQAVSARADPDWGRPDRRADSRPDFPRPGLRRSQPTVAVVIDTSASMSTELLNASVTEIDSLLKRAGTRGVDVVVCDTQAVTPQRVRRLGQLTLTGGGGTDMRIGIEAAAQIRPRPDVIVTLTDGWTPWPPAAPQPTKLIAVVISDDAPLPEGAGIVAVRIREPE